MTVITIIAVAAGLAAPGIRSAIAERRLSQAAYMVARLARLGRAQSIASGRAHLLRYAPADGSVIVYRGNNNRCNGTNWAGIVAGPACGAVGTACLDGMDENQPWFADYEITITSDLAGEINLCWEQDGVLWALPGALNSAPFSDANVVNGALRFSLQRAVGGDIQGVVRQVAVPLSSEARVVR